MKKVDAFTLVELMIIVAILGIMAAIVIPMFQDHTVQASEAAVKDNLRILRNAIEIYATQHNGTPPGYPNDDSSNVPDEATLYAQLVDPGDYLSEMPINSFKQNSSVNVVTASPPVPVGEHGWIYYPAAHEIRVNLAGTDLQGIPYFDY